MVLLCNKWNGLFVKNYNPKLESMIKTLPCIAAILFFTSCNHNAPPKPDADRVIKDTLAQIILQPFNQLPPQQNIYAKVETKQQKMLCARDASIKQVMDGLKAAPQNFLIDNTRPFEVTGKMGTRLSFKAHSFINNEGYEVTEPVTIELKECYSLEAMLSENLLTAADGGLSASKGMVFVNARASGKSLQLRSGQTMDVQFPFAIKGRNGIKVYHGTENADGLVAWNTVSNEGEMFPKVFSSTDFTKPEFLYQGLGVKEYLLQNLSYPEEAKRNELSANVEVTFEVDGHGKVTEVTTAESYKIFRQAIEQSLKDMPAWKPAVYNGKDIAASVHVNIDFNIRRANQVEIDFNEAKASLISAGAAMYVLCGADLKGNVVHNPAVETFGKTGWYNCSREIKAGRKNAELIVCADDKSEIKLLMKNRAAIIGGENCLGYADFKNLPLGEEAYIVAVRYEKGNMLYAVQQVTLSRQTVVSLNWKRGNREEIARVYRKLSQDIS